ncbi:MAG TPA: HAMP domain-containing sensor histidine kinase [Acidimicrobiales bacterium]|jgi:signal transduction histidine kinase|nr:HAMP domain-containing sensor histidine kinase [Acidimicrobiales bacterium]
MSVRRWLRNPYSAHAVRVAIVASVVIATMYVCVVAAFDVIDRHRLVHQVDTRLDQRLDQVVGNPGTARSIGDYQNAHDRDEAPVYLWQAGASGSPSALTPGAPSLSKSDWSPSGKAVVAHLGTESLRLQSRHVGGRWLIAGESLAEVDHVESDLLAVEVVAGPVLLIAVFLGTLLIGIKAASPVEQARRRQLEFTADASHELRTPLSVIEAEVSLVLSGTRSVDDYRDSLERVSRESRRLRDIVEDLLWLSRFDSQPPPPGIEPVDVSTIATACADRFDAVAQRRDVTLSVLHHGEGQAWISAPPEWIDRLTAVLVDNACRYAGRGGTVHIIVTVASNRVSLAVEDSGPGIAPEERERLFDRFHRATDEGNGSGLGLAIADSVVRATGGEWRVDDAELGGARMEVRWHRSQGIRDTGDRSEPSERAEPSDRAEPSPTTSVDA